MCESTCGLRRASALLTHHTLPSQTDRLQGFHRRDLSSLWTQASSTLPTAAWVRIRLLVRAVRSCPWPFLISRFSPFILSTHSSLRGLQPLSQHSFSSTTSNTPNFLMYSISSFRPSLNNFGSIHVPSTLHFPSSSVE